MNRCRSASIFAAISCAALLPFAAAQAQKNTPSPAAKPADITKPAAKAAKVSQASVAAKNKAFATIAPGDAKAKSATDAKNLAEAKKWVGKTGAFSGTVAKVFETRGLVLINFDRDYHLALTAVVRAKNFGLFPDLKTLEGKKVLVSGKVTEYKGQPEITLDALDAIKIIK